MYRSIILCLTVALLAGACTSDEGPAPDAALSPSAVAGPVFQQSEPEVLKRQLGDVAINELSSRDAFAVGSRTDVVGDSTAAAWAFVDGMWRPAELPAPDGVQEHGVTGLVERADGSLLLHGWATGDAGLSFPSIWWGRPGSWEVRAFPDLVADRNGSVNEGVELDGRTFLTGTIWLADDREPALYEFTPSGGLARVPTSIDGTEGALSAAATDGEELVLLAYEGPSDTEEPALLLYGSDAADLALARLEVPGALRIDEVAPSGDGAWVLAGRNPGSASGSIAFWRGTPASGWTPAAGATISGSSSIGDLRLADGRLYASGTLLLNSDDGGRTWANRGRVFGAGGWVRSAAVIDGVEMVSGYSSGSPDIVLAAGADWSPGPATDDAWSGEAGTVISRTSTNLTWGAGVLVALSNRSELIQAGKAQILPGFLVRGGETGTWEPVDQRMRGALTTAAYTEATGFVAGGYRSTDETRWAGGVLLHSPDGREWSQRAATGLVAPEHRIQAIVPISEGVLALGMTWSDATPAVIAFRSTNGADWSAHELAGLDGYGLVDACGEGDEVAAIVFAGGVDRAFARSHDGGATWEVAEDPAFEGASEMNCRVGAGRLVVTVNRPGEDPTLWVEGPDSYRKLEVALDEDTWIGDIEYDAPSGVWLLAGQHGEVVGVPYVAVSRDLDTWVVHDIDADVPEGEGAWANSVAVVGDELVLVGGSEYRRFVWQTDLAALTADLPPPADAT